MKMRAYKLFITRDKQVESPMLSCQYRLHLRLLICKIGLAHISNFYKLIR